MKFSDEIIHRIAEDSLRKLFPQSGDAPFADHIFNDALTQARAALEELRWEDLPIEHEPMTEKVIPIPMLLWCPDCGKRHVDRGEHATKVHRTHACQECGLVWKPAKVATVGVQFLPGYKDPK